MTAVRHRWEGAHIPGRGWWPGGGSWFRWTHGSCVATCCPLGLSLWHCPFWWDVHGLPQLFVETSVLGGLSSLSPGYGQFRRHTALGIPDTGFHRWHHTFCDPMSCLWGGPDGAQGVEGLVVGPDSMVFENCAGLTLCGVMRSIRLVFCWDFFFFFFFFGGGGSWSSNIGLYAWVLGILWDPRSHHHWGWCMSPRMAACLPFPVRWWTLCSRQCCWVCSVNSLTKYSWIFTKV